LVSYNGSPQAQSALNTALVLAERYHAHLTGVLAHGMPYMLYSYGGHVPQSAMDQLLEADREHREQTRKAFMESASALPAAQVHFLDIEAEANEGLMEAALGYDLVVMGADEHAKLAEDLFGGVTNTVLKKGEIPVLLSH